MDGFQNARDCDSAGIAAPPRLRRAEVRLVVVECSQSALSTGRHMAKCGHALDPQCSAGRLPRHCQTVYEEGHGSAPPTLVTTEDTIQRLNDLTETCKDGQLGYGTAAENARNTELESVFSDYAKQRGQFVRALQTEVERLGGTAADSGTLSATLFRGWINLKSALSGGDGGAIVAACESGEEVALGAFELVLSEDITGHSRSLVEKQGRQIREAHAHMLRLKAETSGAAFQKND
jgi:uncharacterized protein (TIGR02284 family)